MRAAQELLGAPTIGRGECPARGCSRGSQRSQISLPSRPERTKVCQNSKFPTLIDLKIAENAIFYLKDVTKYTPETFLRNKLILKFCSYLRHCGVIPVQSFRSHICPQPHGLGLKLQHCFALGIPQCCLILE